MKKEICGNCERGQLRKELVELEPGFFVRAWKCPECGEREYDMEMARKIGAFYRSRQRERTLIKLGRSLAVTLPAELATKYKLKAGEKVYLLEEEEGIGLRPAPA